MADLGWLLDTVNRNLNQTNTDPSGWMRGASGIPVGDPQSADWQAKLAQIQKYDPNASFKPYQSEGGGPTGYTLDFDTSKLPSAPKDAQGNNMGSIGSGTVADFQKRLHDQQMGNYNQAGSDGVFDSINPNAKVTNDPLFGNLISAADDKNTIVPGKTSTFDKLAPMIPALAMGGAGLLFGANGAGIGLTAGGINSAAAGGELAASAGASVGSSGVGNALARFAQGVPGQLASGKFNPASLSGVATAGLGLPSYVMQILNAARQFSGNK